MKKKITAVFCLFLAFLCLPSSVFAKDFDGEDALVSPNIAVYNTENDIFVYKKDAEKTIMPGASAKLMTGILAYEYFEGRLDSVITVDQSALRGLEGSAVLNLKAGEMISVQDLLYAMLVAGMNDAANALAIEIAGSLQNFAALMNEKAEKIGALQTVYQNPAGFDHPNAYTTAADTALIAAYVYQNKTLTKMCSTRAYTVSATNMHDAVTVYTRNALLTPQSEYYYKYAEGLCFGYTETGGYTMISASSAGTYPYICVAMGSEKDDAGTIGGYADIKKLLAWADDNFLERGVLDRSKIMAELPVLAGKSGYVLIVPDENVYAFLDADADLSGLRYSISLDYEELCAPVKKGVIVGTVLVVLDGEPIASTHLVTKNAVYESRSGKFFLNLKNFFTNPIVVVLIAAICIAAAYGIYGKYFRKKK